LGLFLAWPTIKSSSFMPETTMPKGKRRSLRLSTKLVTLGGCMYMVYASCIGSAVIIDFFRHIGANDFHIALVGGVPMMMLSMFFVAALITNRMPRRKPAFIVGFIAARLLYIPVAFLPMIFPGASADWLMGAIILMIAASCALSNFGETLFLSWMADLIPHRILNRFWGTRGRWISATNVACYLAIAAFVHAVAWPITVKFPVLVCIGVVVGIMDILLFFRVDEPTHAIVINRHPVNLLLEPIRHHEYRSFLVFLSIWRASTVIVGVFAVYYLLKVLQLPLANVLIIMSLQLIGPIMTGRMWGRLADRHGHRPVLMVCVALKPIFPLAFLLITTGTVYWILSAALLIDGILNAGLGVAENGFSIKMAPRENRSMFFAAVRGMTGVCAGLATIAIGAYVKHLGDWTIILAGRTWNKYQWVFALSIVLRLNCLLLVRTIREPTSSPPGHLLRDLWQVRPGRPLPLR